MSGIELALRALLLACALGNPCESTLSLRTSDDLINWTYDNPDLHILIGGRTWATVTSSGDILCFDKAEREEPCDCTRMLIAAMAAGKIP